MRGRVGERLERLVELLLRVLERERRCVELCLRCEVDLERWGRAEREERRGDRDLIERRTGDLVLERLAMRF